MSAEEVQPLESPEAESVAQVMYYAYHLPIEIYDLEFENFTKRGGWDEETARQAARMQGRGMSRDDAAEAARRDLELAGILDNEALLDANRGAGYAIENMDDHWDELQAKNPGGYWTALDDAQRAFAESGRAITILPLVDADRAMELYDTILSDVDTYRDVAHYAIKGLYHLALAKGEDSLDILEKAAGVVCDESETRRDLHLESLFGFMIDETMKTMHDLLRETEFHPHRMPGNFNFTQRFIHLLSTHSSHDKPFDT